MQGPRLGRVALHRGNLPGNPASHRCILLPQDFARLLDGVTRLGMIVVVSETTVPRVAPVEALLRGPSAPITFDASRHPELSRLGPVSIVIGASDRHLVVLRIEARSRQALEEGESC